MKNPSFQKITKHSLASKSISTTQTPISNSSAHLALNMASVFMQDYIVLFVQVYQYYKQKNNESTIIIKYMSTSKIDNPEHFEFASVVLKDSKTGITTNRRLLVIKGGHLYYYSNVPKFFNGDPKSLQYHHELPKSSINLVNIKKLKSFQPSSSSFEIVFDQMFVMQRQDIRKTLIQNCIFTPKNKKEEVTWRFTCQNYIVKQKWINYLSQLKEYFIKEKDEIQKYFWNINQKQQMANSMINSKGAKTPWRQSTAMRKQYNTFDSKSMADIGIPNLDLIDGKLKQSRISSCYKPETNKQKFQAEYQHLYKTQNLKQLNMKKVKTMQIQSFKDI